VIDARAFMGIVDAAGEAAIRVAADSRVADSHRRPGCVETRIGTRVPPEVAAPAARDDRRHVAARIRGRGICAAECPCRAIEMVPEEV
jgi:Pyruvate/2-oxoacid:ferredoxin oxidoreductase delta subunit